MRSTHIGGHLARRRHHQSYWAQIVCVRVSPPPALRERQSLSLSVCVTESTLISFWGGSFVTPVSQCVTYSSQRPSYFRRAFFEKISNIVVVLLFFCFDYFLFLFFGGSFFFGFVFVFVYIKNLIVCYFCDNFCYFWVCKVGGRERGGFACLFLFSLWVERMGG